MLPEEGGRPGIGLAVEGRAVEAWRFVADLGQFFHLRRAGRLQVKVRGFTVTSSILVHRGEVVEASHLHPRAEPPVPCETTARRAGSCSRGAIARIGVGGKAGCGPALGRLHPGRHSRDRPQLGPRRTRTPRPPSRRRRAVPARERMQHCIGGWVDGQLERRLAVACMRRRHFDLPLTAESP